jgi:hypothetical protein
LEHSITAQGRGCCRREQPSPSQLAAGYIIVLLVLIPYIAWGVLDEAVGKGTLTRMFFCRSGVGNFVNRRLCGPTARFLNQTRRPVEIEIQP